jgi:hypothetical protein
MAGLTCDLDVVFEPLDVLLHLVRRQDPSVRRRQLVGDVGREVGRQLGGAGGKCYSTGYTITNLDLVIDVTSMPHYLLSLLINALALLFNILYLSTASLSAWS